jgi:hypothetical protein
LEESGEYSNQEADSDFNNCCIWAYYLYHLLQPIEAFSLQLESLVAEDFF